MERRGRVVVKVVRRVRSWGREGGGGGIGGDW